jgi:hypothetical protein
MKEVNPNESDHQVEHTYNCSSSLSERLQVFMNALTDYIYSLF